MGESQNQPFQLSFNRFLRVDFQGSRVTSDGGLLVVRELDERLGLTGLIQNHLVDSRTGRNIQFPLADLFRQFAYSRLAGYEDLNDATRLARDPTFQLMGSKKVWERGMALTSIPQSGIRDGLAGARGELDRFGEAQSGAGGPGGGSRLAAAGGVGYG